MAERDFLDEMVTKRTARNPAFPQILDAARRRRELLRTLAERREQQNQTQPGVAAAVAKSQSFVARLESTAADARVSTVERYAGSLGYVVQYHLVPLDQSADEPTVVVHESSSVSKAV
jgi:predicted transcriptional regulator